MKRVIALILVFTLLVLGCSSNRNISKTNNKTSNDEIANENQQLSINIDLADYDVNKLSDEGLTEYLEDYVYAELIEQLDEGYFIENVDAIYISKEYIEELEFNSKSNVFFGYTLQDIEMAFNDVKYVFSLGEDGSTIVRESELYDDTFDKVIKNVLVGSGVIVVCVTVSAVTAGTAPAVSMIFAVSAKTATECAVSGAVISGATTVAIKGVETGNWNKALKEGVVAASKEFKWGAIGGAIGGGVFEAVSLKGATLNGLTMNEAAKIQRESKLPLGFIKSFHSTDEYNVYKEANLHLVKINGKYVYNQKIDWDFIGDSQGRTNEERVLEGLAPVDSTGSSYEVHHIGQKNDSPFAILTSSQHKKNDKVLHIKNKNTEINRKQFEKEKDILWKALLEQTK